MKELICGKVLNGTHLRAQSVETQRECCKFCKKLIAREIATTLLALVWHVGTTDEYSRRNRSNGLLCVAQEVSGLAVA